MKKVVLTILDGFGIRYDSDGNAIKYSKMNNYNKLLNTYPNCRLEASGRKVGLQKGVPGNSEIGHMSLGAGRIIKQNMMQMEDLFDKDVLLENDTYKKMVEYVDTKEVPLHIMALVSDSGIHSHIKFILKMLDVLHESSVLKVYFHAILDGKDNKETSLNLLNQINDKLKLYKMGSIASVCGRAYAMDKYKNYDKIKIYSDLLTKGSGVFTTDLKTTINEIYKKGYTDYDMPPILLDRNGIVKDGQALLSLNYRKDSIVEILQVLSDSSFNPFDKAKYNDLNVYTIYSIKEVKNNNYFLENTKINSPLGVYLSNLGLNQARIAETFKYSYVNFYFDGCQDLKLENCDRFLIPSKKLEEITSKPEMSSIPITKQALKCMENDYDFIIVNFAAPDMLAKTNDFEATKKGLEILDICLGKIFEVAQDNFYTMFILGDHGNCEDFLKSGNTINPVPFIITDNKVKIENGDLTNVAPTILKYMDISIPKEMKDTDDLFVK